MCQIHFGGFPRSGISTEQFTYAGFLSFKSYADELFGVAETAPFQR